MPDKLSRALYLIIKTCYTVNVIFGILLILLSFTHWFLTYSLVNLTLATFIFMVGNIIFFDSIVNKFTNTSFIKSIIKYPKEIIRSLVCFFVFVFIIEIYAHWLGKYWYFPLMDTTFYFWVEIPLLIIYSLYLLETYQGTKAVLIHIFNLKGSRENIINTISSKVFLICIALLAIGTIFLIWQRRQDALIKLLSINTLPTSPYPILNTLILVLMSVSLWIIMEYLLFKIRKKFSILIKINGCWVSLIIIVVSGISTAIFYEIFNAPGGFWRYGNIPFSEYNFLGIPLLVFMGWPFQYLILIPLYELMTSKSKNILTNLKQQK